MTLKEVCDTYYTTVYHRCLYDLYFNEELAEEAVQQVFVVLCEKWPTLQQHPNLEGWLLRTASYKVQKAKAGYTQRLEFERYSQKYYYRLCLLPRWTQRKCLTLIKEILRQKKKRTGF